MQKDVLPSHKLLDDAYEYQNLFRLKEDNPHKRNGHNQLSRPGLSRIEQESQESLMQGKITFNKIRTKGSNIRKGKL